MRIAVVDDEEIVQKRLEATLRREGHSVETYGSGEDLLSDLEASRTDFHAR
ncbi:MAG TPA: response regulator [Syntrophobacteria bacterium]|nr:response regulator [Syntrophobacteria bacterium]